MLEELIRYIELQTGLNFIQKEAILKQKVQKFLEEYDLSSSATLLHKLKNDKELFYLFVDRLTINETYFFREKEAIELALVKMLQIQQAPYNILVAPCSSGEEVYTILIILSQMGITLDDITIDAIDISQNAIKKAKEAKYNDRSLHRVEKKLKEKYLAYDGMYYTPLKTLQNKINFYQRNIFEMSHLSQKYSLIFSRNLFIYFNDEYKIEAYRELQKISKNEYTQIVLGHADISSKLAKYIKKGEFYNA